MSSEWTAYISQEGKQTACSSDYLFFIRSEDVVESLSQGSRYWTSYDLFHHFSVLQSFSSTVGTVYVKSELLHMSSIFIVSVLVRSIPILRFVRAFLPGFVSNKFPTVPLIQQFFNVISQHSVVPGGMASTLVEKTVFVWVFFLAKCSGSGFSRRRNGLSFMMWRMLLMVRVIYYFGFGRACLSQHPSLAACRGERRGMSLSALLLLVFMG